MLRATFAEKFHTRRCDASAKSQWEIRSPSNTAPVQSRDDWSRANDDSPPICLPKIFCHRICARSFDGCGCKARRFSGASVRRNSSTFRSKPQLYDPHPAPRPVCISLFQRELASIAFMALGLPMISIVSSIASTRSREMRYATAAPAIGNGLRAGFFQSANNPRQVASRPWRFPMSQSWLKS